MFWFTVILPTVVVLLLWPWRRTVRMAAVPRLGGWGWFDLLAPYLLVAVGLAFWLVWHFEVFPFDVLNWIAVGLGVVLFGLVGRVLVLVLEDEDA